MGWAVGYRIPVLPGLAAARGRVRPRRLRSAVPSAPVFQVAPPSPHFSFSGSSLESSGRGIQYRGGALCSGVGQREAGGGRVGIAARRARGGGLFFASESAAAGFGHRVAWSRRGVAARA